MTGKFITFEANEGAGKTTQIRRLFEKLKAQGHDVLLTREPGGSPGAEDIRNLVVQGDAGRWSARTELLLFMAARRDHVERTIQPALDSGKIVLCDRYVGSTLALQVAGGECAHFIKKSHDDFIGLWPDHTVYIDISPSTSVARANAVNGAEDRFESKGADFHTKVDAAFREQAKSPSWIRVNGEQDIDSVEKDIWDIFQSDILK